MPSEGLSINPLAQLEKDLRALERESSLPPKWDATSVDSMVDWLEQEVGLKIRSVPKLLAIVRDLIASLIARQRIRVAILGPRGGGKTLLAASIQLLSLRFYGASWTSVGGSLEQANRLFAHVRAAIQRSLDLQNFIVEALATRITARNGGSITVHAASEKSIRGQHPRGPSGAGGIVLDEASLIEDQIIDAAIPQVASASPSMILQLSTLGESQSGRFWDLIQNPIERGYRVYELSVFDVVRRCPYDCESTCPVPAFAKDQVQYLPDGRVQKVQRALCAGAAHHTDGWIEIDEIVQQYRDLPHQAFRREFLGMRSSHIGGVYDTADIERAMIKRIALSEDPEEAQRRFLLVEKAIGIDWGFAHETWVAYLLRARHLLVVYRWEFWSHTRFSEIREHLLQRIFEDRIHWILPDSANPSDNEELANLLRRKDAERYRKSGGEELGCRVLPVKFSTEKAYGVGEVRRRLEQQLIRFPEVFNHEPVLNRERAMRLLKNYRLDDNGIPVKKEDDCCDALLAGVIRWSPRQQKVPHVY